MIFIKVATVSVLLGLVVVFATIFQFGSALFRQNQKIIFQLCINFATFSQFFSNFLKNMKIQYKSTLNQTKIRISQNLMFKNNNNIIFLQFENILYFEIFKFLGLAWSGFGLCRKIAVWFG